MTDRIFKNPITTMAGIAAGAAVSQVHTGDSTLEVVKYIVSVVFTLWGLFSKHGGTEDK